MIEQEYRVWHGTSQNMYYQNEVYFVFGRNEYNQPGKYWAANFYASDYTIHDNLLVCESTCEKHNFTLMRFTTLFDKTGNKIFEHDVVPCERRRPNSLGFEKQNCLVVWNPLGMWSLKWPDGYINNYPLMAQNLTVIGNPYQKPELFKLA